MSVLSANTRIFFQYCFIRTFASLFKKFLGHFCCSIWEMIKVGIAVAGSAAASSKPH